MKVATSVKSSKNRAVSCKLIIRHGVIRILSSQIPKFKAKQKNKGAKKHKIRKGQFSLPTSKSKS